MTGQISGTEKLTTEKCQEYQNSAQENNFYHLLIPVD